MREKLTDLTKRGVKVVAVSVDPPDETGTVRWRNLTEDYKVRVRGEQILQELDRLKR